MRLEEREVLHQIEILASGHVQVKNLKQVVKKLDDGTEEIISSVPHRSVLDPDDQNIQALLGDHLLSAIALKKVRDEADEWKQKAESLAESFKAAKERESAFIQQVKLQLERFESQPRTHSSS